MSEVFYSKLHSAHLLCISPTKQVMGCMKLLLRISGVYGEYVIIKNDLKPMHKCNVGHATPISLACATCFCVLVNM